MLRHTTLGAVALLTACSAFAPAQIHNGNFTSRTDGWQLHAGRERAIAVDDAQFYRLPLGLRIDHKDEPATSYVGQTFGVKADTTYTLSLWLKTTGVNSAKGGGAGVAVTGSKSGKALGAVKPITGDHAWHNVALIFNSGKETSARVSLRLDGADGAVWFDQVQLREGTHRPQPGQAGHTADQPRQRQEVHAQPAPELWLLHRSGR